MSDVSQEMRQELEEFNLEHVKTLQKTAKALLKKGIVRVHYGVDYVNDDGAPADYAVLEYHDGRIEELSEWCEDLDEQIFQFQVRYCQPYTFEVANAKVFFDDEGGSIDTLENVIRMYHTANRREMLEAEAEEFTSSFEMFSYEHHEVLQPLSVALQAKSIARIFFGVDEVDGTYPVSNWGFVEYENGKVKQLEHFPTELEGIVAVIDELPNVGPYAISSEGMLSEDRDGGVVEIGQSVSRAYHTLEQCEVLER